MPKVYLNALFMGEVQLVLFCFQDLLLNCHNLFVNLFGIPACQKENDSQNFDWLQGVEL